MEDGKKKFIQVVSSLKNTLAGDKRMIYIPGNFHVKYSTDMLRERDLDPF
jgi:hypothetical protein